MDFFCCFPFYKNPKGAQKLHPKPFSWFENAPDRCPNWEARNRSFAICSDHPWLEDKALDDPTDHHLRKKLSDPEQRKWNGNKKKQQKEVYNRKGILSDKNHRKKTGKEKRNKHLTQSQQRPFLWLWEPNYIQQISQPKRGSWTATDQNFFCLELSSWRPMDPRNSHNICASVPSEVWAALHLCW